MTRKERVKKVYELINELGSNEKNFGTLYSKLLSEMELEMEFNNSLHTNRYLFNLRQTKIKQAELYLIVSGRRPKKGAPMEFKEFVSNFRQDTNWALVDN